MNFCMASLRYFRAIASFLFPALPVSNFYFGHIVSFNLQRVNHPSGRATARGTGKPFPARRDENEKGLIKISE